MQNSILIPLTVFLAWVIGAGVVVSSEDRFSSSAATIAKTTTYLSNHPMVYGDGIDKEKIDKANENVEIIRNNFLFVLGCGGCLAGSMVSVLARALAGWLAVRTFAVSLFTSAPLTPYAIRRWTAGSPEECVLVGFLIAAAAWLVWEVIFIISKRIKEAAEKRGLLGVKDELTGRGKS